MSGVGGLWALVSFSFLLEVLHRLVDGWIDGLVD